MLCCDVCPLASQKLEDATAIMAQKKKSRVGVRVAALAVLTAVALAVQSLLPEVATYCVYAIVFLITISACCINDAGALRLRAALLLCKSKGAAHTEQAPLLAEASAGYSDSIARPSSVNTHGGVSHTQVKRRIHFMDNIKVRRVLYCLL